MRPSGIVLTIGASWASGKLAIMSVLVTPGATALTRMLLGASSRARDFVMPLTANLLVG